MLTNFKHLLIFIHLGILDVDVVDHFEAHGKAASSRKILGSDYIYDKFVSASALFKLTKKYNYNSFIKEQIDSKSWN